MDKTAPEEDKFLSFSLIVIFSVVMLRNAFLVWRGVFVVVAALTLSPWGNISIETKQSAKPNALQLLCLHLGIKYRGWKEGSIGSNTPGEIPLPENRYPLTLNSPGSVAFWWYLAWGLE